MKYRKLLNRMLTIEIIGEKLYNALSVKVKDEHLKSLYRKLASNESQTAIYIEKESRSYFKNDCILHKKFISNAVGLFFNLLPADILFKILENALKKRVYKRWYSVYNKKNKELWDALLLHEDVQHELLNLSHK